MPDKPFLTPAQLAERVRADRVLAENHPGQDIAFVDVWSGDTLYREVVAASADPVEFQTLLRSLDPDVRRQMQMTRVPDPEDGLEVPSIQLA